MLKQGNDCITLVRLNHDVAYAARGSGNALQPKGEKAQGGTGTKDTSKVKRKG